jgi:CRP/FNR family transcriptional regulator, nitrogen fixation regulation protein
MDHRLGQPKVMMLPMGRRDIADYLGLTLETVSRALSNLRDRGILSVRGTNQQEIVLHDRSKLAQRYVSLILTALAPNRVAVDAGPTIRDR